MEISFDWGKSAARAAAAQKSISVDDTRVCGAGGPSFHPSLEAAVVALFVMIMLNMRTFISQQDKTYLNISAKGVCQCLVQLAVVCCDPWQWRARERWRPAAPGHNYHHIDIDTSRQRSPRVAPPHAVAALPASRAAVTNRWILLNIGVAVEPGAGAGQSVGRYNVPGAGAGVRMSGIHSLVEIDLVSAQLTLLCRDPLSADGLSLHLLRRAAAAGGEQRAAGAGDPAPAPGLRHLRHKPPGNTSQ